MNRATIDVAGAVTFWSLKSCNARDKLLEALGEAGVDDFMPAPVTQKGALLMALRSMWGNNSGYAIHALQGRSGYEVVEVVPGVDRNAYPQLAWAKVEADGSIKSSLPHDKHYTLLCHVLNALGSVTATDLGSMLTRIVKSRCGAITLRDTGDFYWIGEDQIGNWSKVAAAVENVSGTSVTVARWEATESAVALIVSELDASINAECEKVMKDLTDGQEHTSKFYEARKDVASAMRKKIQTVRKQLDLSKVASEDTLAATEAALTACLFAQ